MKQELYHITHNTTSKDQRSHHNRGSSEMIIEKNSKILYDLVTEKKFLNGNLAIQETRSIFYKWNLMKAKIFRIIKET